MPFLNPYPLIFPSIYPTNHLSTYLPPAMKEKASQEEAAKMDPAMLEHIAFFESEDTDTQSSVEMPKRVFNSFGWVTAAQVRGTLEQN